MVDASLSSRLGEEAHVFVKIVLLFDTVTVIVPSLTSLHIMSTPADVCQKALKGLEPDILDYIVEMLESRDGDIVDIKDSIVSFLVGAEFSASEEEAAAVCADIFSRLDIEAVAPTVHAEENAPTALLDKPKSLVSSPCSAPQYVNCLFNLFACALIRSVIRKSCRSPRRRDADPTTTLSFPPWSPPPSSPRP